MAKRPPRREEDASLVERGYRIFETEPFLETLAALPPADRSRLTKKLQDFIYPLLRTQPYHGPWIKKLKGYRPDTWRFRVGSWRIFYGIDESKGLVLMTAVDDRKDAYR